MNLYQKFRDIWKNKPDKTTPVTAEAMMHIEQGIYDNSANIINLENKITDGIKVIDATLYDVKINTRSAKGLYYGTVTSLASIGIQVNSVVSLTIIGFGDSQSVLGLTLSSDGKSISGYSDISQTINYLTIRVSYIETSLSSISIVNKGFSGVSINTPTGNGLYCASLTTLEDMGIPEDATTIGILSFGWSNLTSSFQLYLSDDKKEVMILCGNIQSNVNISVRVAYFIP